MNGEGKERVMRGKKEWERERRVMRGKKEWERGKESDERGRNGELERVDEGKEGKDGRRIGVVKGKNEQGCGDRWEGRGIMNGELERDVEGKRMGKGEKN